MKPIITTSLVCLTLAATVGASAQSLVFSEDFGTLSNGTALTPTLTDFNYITSYGTREISNPTGENAALRLTSANAGNIVAGFGVSGLAASSVFSVGFDVTLSQLPGGTSIRFAMGQAGGSLYPAQGANPPRIDNNTNYAAWAEQSLFVVNLGGNGALGSDFGLLGTLNSSGSAFSQVNNAYVFNPGASHSLHFVANGGASAITLGADTIGAGQLGVYVDGVFVASVVMSNNVTADTFVVYSHGRSANNDFAQGTLDNFRIWDGAISPAQANIPEPSSFALLGGAAALGCVVAGRRRRRA